MKGMGIGMADMAAFDAGCGSRTASANMDAAKAAEGARALVILGIGPEGTMGRGAAP